MLANQLLDFVVLVLYFAVMIGAGYWGLRRARSADDYLVAGRRLGPFMYIGCLSAVVQRESSKTAHRRIEFRGSG
jgi:Na+/proline symporter